MILSDTHVEGAAPHQEKCCKVAIKVMNMTGVGLCGGVELTVVRADLLTGTEREQNNGEKNYHNHFFQGHVTPSGSHFAEP